MISKSNRLKLIATALAAFITAPVSANEEVFSILSKSVMEWSIKLGERTKQCYEDKRTNTPPKLTIDTLKSNNISRGDAVIAIGYIALRNDYLCDNNERVHYAFSLGTLNAAIKEYGVSPTMEELGINDDSIETVQAGLVYPSMQYIELSADYGKLSPNVREFFEKLFGTNPFDASKIYDSLPPL